MLPPWQKTATGLTVLIRLTPRAGRDAIEGVIILANLTSVLKIRVRAMPEDQAANQAMITLLSKAIRIPAKNISISSGATARIKRVDLTGNSDALICALQNAIPNSEKLQISILC